MPKLQLDVTHTWGNRTLPINSPAWKRLRLEVLERDNYTCRFCGHRAQTYMVCDHIDGNASNNDLSNLGINCQACDKIRHCGFAGLNDLLELYESDMNQVSIVLLTRDFYKKYGYTPAAREIDPRAKVAEMDIVTYANSLLGAKQRGLLTRYPQYDYMKGFFANQFTNLAGLNMARNEFNLYKSKKGYQQVNKLLKRNIDNAVNSIVAEANRLSEFGCTDSASRECIIDYIQDQLFDKL